MPELCPRCGGFLTKLGRCNRCARKREQERSRKKRRNERVDDGKKEEHWTVRTRRVRTPAYDVLAVPDMP